MPSHRSLALWDHEESATPEQEVRSNKSMGENLYWSAGRDPDLELLILVVASGLLILLLLGVHLRANNRNEFTALFQTFET